MAGRGSCGTRPRLPSVVPRPAGGCDVRGATTGVCGCHSLCLCVCVFQYCYMERAMWYACFLFARTSPRIGSLRPRPYNNRTLIYAPFFVSRDRKGYPWRESLAAGGIHIEFTRRHVRARGVTHHTARTCLPHAPSLPLSPPAKSSSAQSFTLPPHPRPSSTRAGITRHSSRSHLGCTHTLLIPGRVVVPYDENRAARPSCERAQQTMRRVSTRRRRRPRPGLRSPRARWPRSRGTRARTWAGSCPSHRGRPGPSSSRWP